VALKATIFKAELQIADMDRNYYADHVLTIARHPSETDARMMVRLLAFALHADEALAFTKGLCVDDEPDLWQRDPNGEIALWIDVGQPDERRLRKACGRARRIVVYNYGGRSADIWWDRIGDQLARFDNLMVIDLPASAVDSLAQLAQRTMRLQSTVQEGRVWIGDGEVVAEIELGYRMGDGSSSV
jgi:uncharacterized protein YaeQ